MIRSPWTPSEFCRCQASRDRAVSTSENSVYSQGIARAQEFQKLYAYPRPGDSFFSSKTQTQPVNPMTPPRIPAPLALLPVSPIPCIPLLLKNCPPFGIAEKQFIVKFGMAVFILFASRCAGLCKSAHHAGPRLGLADPVGPLCRERCSTKMAFGAISELL